MQKLIFRNGNGVEVNLTSGNFGITNWKGFDNAGLNIQSQTVPFTDGSVFIDALLNNRELSVTVALQDNGDLEKRYELKRELIKILNPKLGEGVLTYTNDFLSKQIKVVPSIPIFQNKNSNDKGTQKGTLVFTACNPYWEDTEETVVNLNGGDVVDIDNDGDVETQVIMDYEGYSQDIAIENFNTQKKIELDGISSNRKISIKTEFGRKEIKAVELSRSLKYQSFEYDAVENIGNNYFYIKNKADGSYILVESSNKITRIDFAKRLTMSDCNYEGEMGNVAVPYVHYSEYMQKYFICNGTGFYVSSDLMEWTETTEAVYLLGNYLFKLTYSSNQWSRQRSANVQSPSWTNDNLSRKIFYREDYGYYVIDTANSRVSYGASSVTSLTNFYSYSSPMRVWDVAFFNGKVYIQGNYGASYSRLCYQGTTEAISDLPVGYGTIILYTTDDYAQIEDLGLFNKDGVKVSDYFLWVKKGREYIMTDGFYNLKWGYSLDLRTITYYEEMIFTGISFDNEIYYGYADGKLYVSSDLQKFYHYADVPTVTEFADNMGVGNNTGFIIDKKTVKTFIHTENSPNRIRKQNGYYYICGENGCLRSSDLITWTSVFSLYEVFDVSDNGEQVVFLTANGVYIGDTLVEDAPQNLKKIEWSNYYQKYLVASPTVLYASGTMQTFVEVQNGYDAITDLKYDGDKTCWWILADTKLYVFYHDLLLNIDFYSQGIISLTPEGCLIVSEILAEYTFSENENLIDKLSAQSNMSFGLETGNNQIIFDADEKDLLSIRFKKKYVGV